MCKYCKTLADLRRSDLAHYEYTLNSIKEQFREDDMLLRRCLIALSWKENQVLVDDILKVIEGGDRK